RSACVCYVFDSDLAVLHSFPTRRSSDLGPSIGPLGRTDAVRIDEIAVLHKEVRCLFAHRRENAVSVHGVPAISLATQVAAEEKRSEEHTSELQSRENLVCRLLLEKKKQQ